MTTPMIVPAPELPRPFNHDWTDAQWAAAKLLDNSRYVVVDLGLDGLPQVTTGGPSDRSYWTSEFGPRTPDGIAEARRAVAALLAMDKAMHASAPVDVAVDAVAEVVHAEVAGVVNDHQAVRDVAVKLVAAVRAADEQARH